MRSAILLTAACLLSACQREPSPTQPPASEQTASPTRPQGVASIYAGSGRDRFCLDPRSRRAGFISYGPERTNCAMRGTLGEDGTFRPDGDNACSVHVTVSDQQVALVGTGGEACAYYCGPDATYSGKSFTRMAQPDNATDLAGDPLC